jgi:signal transduction histidine kinase
MAINVAVIGFGMLAVWLSIDILAADYTTRLMSEFNMPIRLHWLFLSTVHRYLMWTAIVTLSLAIVFSLLLTRHVLSPLKQMRRVAGRIAGGDYTEKLHISSHDEIADLGRDLNTMAASLEKIEALRQDMVADVAHELRTPLTNMRGYIEGLIDGVVPPTPEQFSLLHEETLRLVSLVDDLLRLAEADASDVTATRETVALAPVIRNVVKMATPRADEKHLTFEIDVPEGFAVLGDSDKLTQVFHNLVDNAVRYSPDTSAIGIRAWRPAATGTASVTVSNHWDGPMDADFDLNFERFHRSEKSRSRRYGGAGIGLAIARKLVESQGGEIRGDVTDGRVTIHLTFAGA